VRDKKRLRAESLDFFVDVISGPAAQGSFFQHQFRRYDDKRTSELTDRLRALGQLPVQIL
jgi:hypothetical protein